jgi:hypothetical protein
MRSRLFLVLLLLALPVATVALPPDPLWIHGLYDGGDYDDCLIVSEPSAGVTPPMGASLTPPQRTAERVAPLNIDGPSRRVVRAPAPRSPPPA